MALHMFAARDKGQASLVVACSAAYLHNLGSSSPPVWLCIKRRLAHAQCH